MESRAVEYSGPEEKVEVNDVLPNEVDDLGLGPLPVIIGSEGLVLGVVSG